MEGEEDGDHNPHSPPPTTTAPSHIDPADNDDEDLPDPPQDLQDQEDDSASLSHLQDPSLNEKDELLSDDDPEPQLDPALDDAPPTLPSLFCFNSPNGRDLRIVNRTCPSIDIHPELSHHAELSK